MWCSVAKPSSVNRKSLWEPVDRAAQRVTICDHREQRRGCRGAPRPFGRVSKVKLFVGELAPAGASARLFIRVRKYHERLALVEHIAADILGNQLSPLQAELVSPAAYELQQIRR